MFFGIITIYLVFKLRMKPSRTVEHGFYLGKSKTGEGGGQLVNPV